MPKSKLEFIPNVDEANAEVARLTEQLATVNTNLTTATEKLTKVEGDLTAATEKLTKVEGDLTTATEKLTKAETNLTAAETNVTNLTSELTKAKASATKVIAGAGINPLTESAKGAGTEDGDKDELKGLTGLQRAIRAAELKATALKATA